MNMSRDEALRTLKEIKSTLKKERKKTGWFSTERSHLTYFILSIDLAARQLDAALNKPLITLLLDAQEAAFESALMESSGRFSRNIETRAKFEASLFALIVHGLDASPNLSPAAYIQFMKERGDESDEDRMEDTSTVESLTLRSAA